MNSDIRYLQLLEDDLREAAQFERELDEEERVVDAQGRRRAAAAPRRLPRRGKGLGVAAALVAFLVMAGGIGFLAQHGWNHASTGAASMPSASSAFGLRQQAILAPPAPRPADQAPALNNFGTADVVKNMSGSGGIAHAIGSGAGNSSGLTAPGPQGDLSKIEKDGQIGIQMDNGQFTAGVKQVMKIAADNKGSVLSSTSDNDRSGTFTLRIPAAHFDRVMTALREIAPAGGILYQDSTGKDVTASFIDFHARLGILKGQRDLLIGLQSKVTDAGAILFYADKINAVQLNIETIQGDLNFLNDSVAQSTIKVELREKDAPQGTVATDVNKPSLRSAWNFSIQGFLRVLGAVVIGLGYLIPLSIIGLLIWGGVMLARRRRPAAS